MAAEIRQSAAYLGDRSRLEQLGRDEFAAGVVVVIDARAEPEYAAGHTAGARSIPIDDLAANIKDLPADIEIVAYFLGPCCVFADDAREVLVMMRDVMARESTALVTFPKHLVDSCIRAQWSWGESNPPAPSAICPAQAASPHRDVGFRVTVGDRE